MEMNKQDTIQKIKEDLHQIRFMADVLNGGSSFAVNKFLDFLDGKIMLINIYLDKLNEQNEKTTIRGKPSVR